jgi:lipid II:glycine glycyltransferase (peptidoglycan interpeptide bridge formation enzyme)
MKRIVKIHKNPGKEEHWAFLAEREEYSFFQSPVWIESLVSSFPVYSNNSYLFEFEDGNKVFCPLICVKKYKGLVKAGHSMPFHTYGGLLSLNQNINDYASTVIQELKKDFFFKLVITQSPLEENLELNIGKKIPLSTHILNLESDYSSVWETKYDSKNRNQIRKARNSGMEIAVNPENAGDVFYKLYMDSLENRKTKTSLFYPLSLFQNLAGNADTAKYYFAVQNLKILAGILILIGKNTALYWSAASTGEGKPLCANQFLLDYAIQDAIRNNIRIFDMGASKGMVNLNKFKEAFGAREKNYYSWSFGFL